MLVSKGEQLICSNGHIIGSVGDDVSDGNDITPHDLRVDFDLISLKPAADGHFCKACGERVTDRRQGLYRVHTKRGWIGQLP
jgi:hypothetical protein